MMVCHRFLIGVGAADNYQGCSPGLLACCCPVMVKAQLVGCDVRSCILGQQL